MEAAYTYMGLCHGPGVLERSGPTWGVLDFSGFFWILFTLLVSLLGDAALGI